MNDTHDSHSQSTPESTNPIWGSTERALLRCVKLLSQAEAGAVMVSTAMPVYTVERTFSPPLTEQDFLDTRKLLGPCNQARDIKWLGSNFAADGSRCICMYEAADAERIREANRVAGMPYDRVWVTNVYRPAAPPSH